MLNNKSYGQKAVICLAIAVLFYFGARVLPQSNTVSVSLGVALEIGSLILLPFIAVYALRALKRT